MFLLGQLECLVIAARRRVQGALQKALDEDARGREERMEAHEARLKRIMVDRWHKRQEEVRVMIGWRCETVNQTVAFWEVVWML